jgi:hypothetical protein
MAGAKVKAGTMKQVIAAKRSIASQSLSFLI